MSAPDDRSGQFGHEGEEDLFDDIREFLTEQSSDRIFEDLAQAYGLAKNFVDRELRGIDEFGRMLRALERLVDEIFESEFKGEQREKIAEGLYLYGLAHYSLMQQIVGSGHGAEGSNDDDEPVK